MQDILPVNITEDQFLKLFIALYSLPKYGDQIRSTIFDSEERTQKVEELRHKLQAIATKMMGRDLYSQEQKKEFLSALTYYQGQAYLKNRLVDYLKQLYPGLTSFVVINYINEKLGGRYEKECENLLGDLIQRNKQESMKHHVQQILINKFKDFDEDGTGTIDMYQIQRKLQKNHLPKIIAKQIMEKADVGGNGLISLQQFKQYTQKNVLKYYKIFYNLDSDNDHRLNYHQTKQSLHQIYPNIQIDEVFDQIFRTMDQDNSGLINFDEWCQFLILLPRHNFNVMINEWKMFAFTMINAEQSSSFINKDLIGQKKGKNALTWVDLVRTLIFGGISGALSRTITAPLQRLKVIYQTMYLNQKCPSISAGIVQTYKKHGMAALFRGNSISVFLSCLQQAMRFTIIQYSKKVYEQKGDQIHPHQFLFIGVVTGIVSTVFLFPFEVLRIRFIASDDRGVFHQIKQIYQKSGPKGFYSGFLPHLISVLPSGSFNVMSYNLLRRMFIKQSQAQKPNVYKFMMIGGFASLITNTVTYPLSLITSRIIMANKDIKQFKNRTRMFGLIKQIHQHEGFLGFYKGFQASTLRIFIGQAFNFGTYQSLKSVWNGYKNPRTKKY